MSVPALVLLLVVALTAVNAVRTQLECVDAARDAALAAARGADGVAAGLRHAPPGARVRLSTGADTVTATVSVQVGAVAGASPGFEITASATAQIEPA